MEIGYCLDCNELNYAMTNANGNFERANMSNNHEGHRQYVFESPDKYTPPIRNVLTKLQAGLPISDNEIVLFKLAITFGDLDKVLTNLFYSGIISVSERRQADDTQNVTDAGRAV